MVVQASSSPADTCRPRTLAAQQSSSSSPSADLHASDTWKTPSQVGGDMVTFTLELLQSHFGARQEAAEEEDKAGVQTT